MGAICGKKKKEGENNVPDGEKNQSRGEGGKGSEAPKQTLDLKSYFQKTNQKMQSFSFNVSEDFVSFEKRLALLNGISLEMAKDWIQGYIVYMIIRAYTKSVDKKKETYAPYSIQQVQRLHILSYSNYEKFCDLLGYNLIHFNPSKLISTRIKDLMQTYQGYYDYTLENLQTLYPSLVDDRIMSLFEPFEVTFCKNEFSFQFLTKKDRQKFDLALLSHMEVFETLDFKVKYLSQAYKAIRSCCQLDQFVAEYSIPKIEESVVCDDSQRSIAAKIDQFKIPHSFVRLLAWELQINTQLAVKMILEYKKFMFVVLTENTFQPVPSEKINQVWQLHRQYTNLYFQDVTMVKNFQQNLYLDPEGGYQAKYEGNYKKTMEAVNKAFPDADKEIWANEGEDKFYEFAHCSTYYLFFFHSKLSKRQKITIIEKYKLFQKSLNKDTTKHDYRNNHVFGKILMLDSRYLERKIEDDKFKVIEAKDGNGKTEVDVFDFTDKDQPDANDLSYNLVVAEEILSQRNQPASQRQGGSPNKPIEEQKQQQVGLEDIVIPKNLESDRHQQKQVEDESEIKSDAGNSESQKEEQKSLEFRVSPENSDKKSDSSKSQEKPFDLSQSQKDKSHDSSDNQVELNMDNFNMENNLSLDDEQNENDQE